MADPNQKDPVTVADLADFDEAYKDSEVTDDEFEPIPDGRYQVVVDRVELVRTTKGDPMLKWTLRILGPTHQGRLLWRNNVMATEQNVRWLKRDLYTCELRLARISELPANLEKLLDIKLEVTKKTQGEFDAVYLNRRIRTAGETPSSSAGRSHGKARDALSKF